MNAEAGTYNNPVSREAPRRRLRVSRSSSQSELERGTDGEDIYIVGEEEKEREMESLVEDCDGDDVAWKRRDEKRGLRKAALLLLGERERRDSSRRGLRETRSNKIVE